LEVEGNQISDQLAKGGAGKSKRPLVGKSEILVLKKNPRTKSAEKLSRRRL
jgi:hypothetical protein